MKQSGLWWGEPKRLRNPITGDQQLQTNLYRRKVGGGIYYAIDSIWHGLDIALMEILHPLFAFYEWSSRKGSIYSKARFTTYKLFTLDWQISYLSLPNKSTTAIQIRPCFKDGRLGWQQGRQNSRNQFRIRMCRHFYQLSRCYKNIIIRIYELFPKSSFYSRLCRLHLQYKGHQWKYQSAANPWV